MKHVKVCKFTVRYRYIEYLNSPRFEQVVRCELLNIVKQIQKSKIIVNCQILITGIKKNASIYSGVTRFGTPFLR